MYIKVLQQMYKKPVDREKTQVEKIVVFTVTTLKIMNWVKAIKEKLLTISWFEIFQLKILSLIEELIGAAGASISTAHAREACQSLTVALDGIMEALTCGHNNTIGVLGTESPESADLLEKVSRRAKRDNLFDVVVIATLSHKPNDRRIQDEIAKALGLKFDDENKDLAERSIRHRAARACCLKSDDEKKDVAERAKRLRERILMEQKILLILCGLWKGLDLDNIGIPSGADHTGCKLLLTSASEEVLSKEMHAQAIFKV